MLTLCPRHTLTPPAPAPVTYCVCDLTLLGTSWEWGHTGCVLLCLAHATKHRVLRAHHAEQVHASSMCTDLTMLP